MKNIVIYFLLISPHLFSQNQVDTTPVRKIDAYSKIFKNSLQDKQFVDFYGEIYKGKTFELANYKGNVIVLNFWFIGCPPCLGEIGDFNTVYNKFKDSTVKIISVANNSKDQIEKFIAGRYSKPIEQIQYPIVTGADKAIKEYEVASYPTTVLIDKKGIVRLVYSGASVSSLQKYVEFYGDKGLSKEWKQILKNGSGQPKVEMSAFLNDLIEELLKE